MEDELSTELDKQEAVAHGARTLPMFSLEDRVAVVTGAGSGIGQRISIGFASCGAEVVLVDINEAGLVETVELINATVSDARAPWPVKCDVSQEDQVVSLFNGVQSRFGRVDVLLNGAFTPVLARPHALTLELWQRSVDVNLTGYFLCARSAGQAMIEAGRGSIINISSIAGVSGLGRGNFVYSVTKGGIVQMTRELAVEWGRYGIRVNAILPVQTRTKGFQARLDHPDTDAPGLTGRVLGAIPLGRMAEPEDFVGPSVFLASDASAMVSGTMLPVDGGNLAMNASARADE
ncbi:MAG TPA: SDR family NAD(P)-dependent oxidoreductase [Acidimicrobiales bacterium]|nr:SDR family NAD(P)-dependent oxidoreductase [Acidimicrobiales bacterium]